MTKENRPDFDKLEADLKELGANYVVADKNIANAEFKKEMKSWFGKNAPLLGLNCVGGKSAVEMAKYLG